MQNAQLKLRLAMERAIAEALVRAAIRRGLLVSVYSDMTAIELVLSSSTSVDDVMKSMFTTDNTTLVILSHKRRKLGWIQLIYGNNGHDVIHDYSVTDAVNDIVAEADALAERMRNGEWWPVAAKDPDVLKLQQYEVSYAIGAARNVMEGIVKAHEDQVNTLRSYLKRFDEVSGGQSGSTTHVDVIDWFLGATRNLATNMRTDMLPSAAARIATAQLNVRKAV
jgi:hypothetical protein